jgi:hypothetical protein
MFAAEAGFRSPEQTANFEGFRRVLPFLGIP